jgi:hypothetical protein
MEVPELTSTTQRWTSPESSRNFLWMIVPEEEGERRMEVPELTSTPRDGRRPRNLPTPRHKHRKKEGSGPSMLDLRSALDPNNPSAREIQNRSRRS